MAYTKVVESDASVTIHTNTFIEQLIADGEMARCLPGSAMQHPKARTWNTCGAAMQDNVQG